MPRRASAAAATLRAALRRTALGGAEAEPLFVTRQAQELLFGYSDALFQALHETDPSFPNDYPGLVRNETAPPATGLTRMYTGKLTATLARSLLTWEDMSSLLCCAAGPCGPAGPQGTRAHPSWASDDANDVQGTLGLHFQSAVSADDALTLFSEQLVRTRPSPARRAAAPLTSACRRCALSLTRPPLTA